MNTAKVKELAEEYVRFQNVDVEKVDLKDHMQLYESLTNKIEEAGISFYELSRYLHFSS